MTESAAFDLSSLFGAALTEMVAHRQEVNDLDGHNGNHGDNMVENLGIIRDALSAQQGKPPTDALRFASHELETRGHGGTSQFYVQGLNQAAEQLQGRSGLDQNGVMSIAQSLLGAIPAQAGPQQQGGGSVLEQVIGLATGAGAAPQAAPQAGGGLLGNVLGGLLGGAAQPQPAQPQPAQEAAADDGLGMDDVLGALLPAGLAFLRAKQSGQDPTAAAGQALIAGLLGGQVNPLQATTPRAAAGELVAQSLLKALVGGAR